mgnify:FL=1|jgi:hypothetical protein
MSGIVGSFFNHRGSGIVSKLGTDGHSYNSAGAGIKLVTEAAAAGGDLSFGGDTFGENKVIGANDGYSLSLETSGNTAMTISSAGEITLPLQSCWGGSCSAASNVTGDRTTYTVGAGETFDLNGDFSSSTFTAPVTGKYLLCLSLRMTGVDSGMTRQVATINTSNRNYTHTQSGSTQDFNADNNFDFQVLADMDASDTAYLQIFMGHPGPGGDGDKTADVQGGWFSGALMV